MTFTRGAGNHQAARDEGAFAHRLPSPPLILAPRGFSPLPKTAPYGVTLVDVAPLFPITLRAIIFRWED